MADVKQKPKMEKPKTKNSDLELPKDARRMLTNEYRAAAGERAQDVRQRPEQEAVGKVEDSMRSTRDHGIAAAKRGARELKRNMKDGMTEKKDARPAQAGHPASGRKADSAKNTPVPKRTQNGGRSVHGTATESVKGRTKDQQRMDARRNAIKEKQARHNEANRSGSAHTSSNSPHSSDMMPSKGKTAPDIKTKKSVSSVGKARTSRKSFRLKTRATKTASKAKKTAKSAQKLKQRAQMVAKAAKKAAVTGVKLAKKLAMALAKAAAAVGKAIIAALGPVGVVILIFVVVAAIAALIASPFGLFVSGEDDDSKAAMQGTVAAISYEYHENIQSIIRNNQHDEMRFEYINHGYARTDNWIDVLAIYACKTANFGEDGIDVAELDDIRIEKLKGVFWDMENVTHERKNKPIYDAETDTYTNHYILFIRAECVDAWTMADTYGFDSEQREVLGEMLSGEYDDYFREMIGSAGLFTALGNGGAVVGTGNFIWPSAASNYITSPHGSRIHPITGKRETHYGIDISAGAGTGVLAADGGTVTRNNIDPSYGIHLLIDHGNGYQTLYAHMSAANVDVGATVEQGQVIGLVGSTGTSTNPHLHFEVRVNGSHVDPLQFFDNYTTAW